jgi:hypothetical protein
MGRETVVLWADTNIFLPPSSGLKSEGSEVDLVMQGSYKESFRRFF